jgi:glycosyltransferase involved in cell wall biosynthesis
MTQFSILMPVRDAEQTVVAAIESTLRAMGSEDELIVGFHESTDTSRERVDSLTDSRLKLFDIKGDTLGDALNDLSKYAQNQYIARMDSDDICLPWRFKIQRRLLLKYDFVFSTAFIQFLDRGKVTIPQYPTRLSTSRIGKLCATGNPLVHPSMACKIEPFKKLQYRATSGEDLDLWLRGLLGGFSFVRGAVPTIVYRIWSGQLSQQDEYRSGWESSAEILGLRRQCKDYFSDATFGIRGFLELTGLPSPSKIASALRIVSDR